ncbi:SNF2 family N-terminal domain-containing protein [Neurospora hispaniola]|uniref:SNF2 family N-terminal domain-containing protein n=1 Tax=Neurospora hispaniola TaxID=588809 RepID=A0AAJ0ICF5_9PEZI|nr:SNF2 family N-terminal domain-containing protein [Neurospora hispaniola]
MAFSSLPEDDSLRSSSVVVDSPVPQRRTKPDLDFIDEDDEDELSIVSQSPYFTQPTQIASQPTVKPREAAIPSSPTVVEVPASSPFRQQSSNIGGRFASAMAPRGTSFKAPAAQSPPVKAGAKRDYIMIDDDEFDKPLYAGDSSDDEGPARGDIQPSAFKKPNLTSAKAAPAVYLKPSKKPKLSNDVGSPITSPAKPYVLQEDWVTLRSSSPESLQSIRPKDSPLKPAPAPPAPARRRLIQGRRRRSPSPASSPAKPIEKPVPKLKQTKIITLVSDDEDDDDYVQKKSVRSPEPQPELSQRDPEEDAFEERVLKYLNTCDPIQLMAIANVKEDVAKHMLSYQPFDSVADAERVTMAAKATKVKRKKSTRAPVGEDIVGSIKEYTKALDGIDHVIAVCESQAAAIKDATSRWKVDQTGQPRTVKNKDGTITPLSIDGTTTLVDLPLSQPKLMSGCTMKPFQLYGLNWLYLLYENQYASILADDMGLGKTCQVISLISAIVEEHDKHSQDDDSNQPWPNIIFVPPSTLANWAAEFKRFAPGLNVTLYQGSQSVRDEIADNILDDPASHHVVLTSYSQVSRQDDISNLRRLKPMVAVFDEGHKMKNPKTKLYKDLLKITATWRLILSGTPVQNNLMEMISLLQFVEPELFRDHFDDLEALFNQKFSLTAVSQGALLHSERVARARTILEPFILQRRKEQVLKDMPPKTAKVVYCEMDDVQAAIYKDYERRFRKTDATGASSAGRDNDNNNVWIQLRKSAIHPQLFRRYFNDSTVEKMANILMKKVDQSELRQPKIEHLINELKALSDFELHLWCRDYKCIRQFDLPDGSWMESAKVQALLKLIKQYQKNGDRALVFTRFAKVIEILGECLASEKIEYLSLQGNTDVSERQELINDFNADATIPVFLLTTGSGGTGINLTAANKVIIFDQSDNPQDDIQAENRAHRLGQTRPVEIVRLISKDTVEELVYKACQKKLELANKVVGWSTVEMSQSEMEAQVRAAIMNGGSIATPPSD